MINWFQLTCCSSLVIGVIWNAILRRNLIQNKKHFLSLSLSLTHTHTHTHTYRVLLIRFNKVIKTSSQDKRKGKTAGTRWCLPTNFSSFQKYFTFPINTKFWKIISFPILDIFSINIIACFFLLEKYYFCHLYLWGFRIITSTRLWYF